MLECGDESEILDGFRARLVGSGLGSNPDHEFGSRWRGWVGTFKSVIELASQLLKVQYYL